MKRFKTYIEETYDFLIEKLITFSGQAYPKFGHVVILAGGAGSGKGYIKKKLMGIEGYTFDVDAIKTLVLKAPYITNQILKKTGKRIDQFDLTDPSDVFDLHSIVGDLFKLDDKRLKTLYTSILVTNPERKPNIIFDVTLKDLNKLQQISNFAKNVGYDKKKIHLVWVVNDIKVATQQNLNPSRGRVVPQEILVNTHRGVSQTMRDIVDMGSSINKYLDGDIVIAFNKADVDTTTQSSNSGGSYIKLANYFYIKKSGKNMLSFDAISTDIKKKIANYTPKGLDWK